MKKQNFKYILLTVAATLLFAGPVHCEEADKTVNLTTRYQDQVLFTGAIAVPSSTAFNYVDAGETKTTSTGYTALAALLNADAASDNFSVSKIDYYSSWGSFYITCLSLAPTGTEACNNWQYTVNGQYPSVGADAYPLNGGEQIYFYFGDRNKITVPSSSFSVDETATGTIFEYNYETNVYSPLPGSVLGLLDANDNALLTTTSDANGEAAFTLAATGTFKIGMQNASDWGAYYWPKSADFIVNEKTTTDENNDQNQQNNNTNGGGSEIIDPNEVVNVDNAVNFIVAQQKADGSFESALHSDWVAIALSAYNQNNSAREKLKQYLLTDPSPAGGMNSVSDFARRAMALLALNINPYNGTATDYIQKLTEQFDGAQFGDKNLFNDDIFALFPLLKSGYQNTDPIIASTTQFILSKQSANGDWGGTDLTAAAIQALSLLTNVNGTSEAIAKAKNYLREQQQANGGFNNSFSTSWAIQAIVALNESQNLWMKNSKMPANFLYSLQAVDGGMENQSSPASTRLWATAYAVPAALNKSWNQILNTFAKPQNYVANTGVNLNSAAPIPSSTVSSTADLSATSTLNVAATTTPEQITTSTPETPDTSTPVLTTTAVSLSSQTSPPRVLGEGGTTAHRPVETGTPHPDITSGIRNDSEKNSTTEQLSANPAPAQLDANKLINQLPLSSPTRRTVKKILAVSGGGAAALGLYLGLKLLRGVV